MQDIQSTSFIIPLVSFNNTKFVKQLGAHLEKNGHEFVVLPKNKHVEKEAKSQLSTKKVLESSESHTPERPFDALLQKYDVKSTRNFVFSDMVYDYDYLSPNYSFYTPNRKIPYKKYEDRVHRWLDKLDLLFDEEGYVPIQNQGGEIFRHCLHTVAEHHGYSAIWLGFSPVERMTGLHTNSKMYYESLDAVSYDSLSIDEKKEAEEMVRQITTEYSRYSHGEKTLQGEISQKAQAIKNYRSNVIGPTISWLRESLLGMAKKAYFSRLYASQSESVDFVESESFVYYPIQYFRESRVTNRSNAFYNQLWLAEYLSRSVPYGRELAVKDHPNMVGAQPISVPRRLARVAKALAPKLNSRRIIKNADAVVTLNNTVGFEALMYGKPVVALGSGFYADSQYVYSVDDINDIESVLYEAVHSDGLSKEEVIEVAAAIRRDSYRGRWGDASKSNVRQFGDSVLEFLAEQDAE